ncbi:hypothetical protein EV368DRAFT_66569 [Lentinula lateritia]|nr:hypothetical protein EV368DRAFT_66569 [Lentinula lateritia]
MSTITTAGKLQSWKELISLQGSDYRNSKWYKDAAEVPPEILPECIWALEWFIRALTDGSELQLRTFGYILLHQSANEARYFMSSNAWFKAASHLLSTDQESVNQSSTNLWKRCDIFAQRWTQTRNSVLVFSVAPAWSRTDVDKAKETLSRIISDKNIDKSSQGMIFLSKIYLFRVLRRLGEEKDAQKHEQWLIKWLKRNSHCLPELTFVEIFTTYINIKEDTVWAAKKFVSTVKHANLKSSCLNVVCWHIFNCISYSDGYDKLVSSELRARSFLLMGHAFNSEHATESKRIENLALHKAHLAIAKSRQNKFKVVGADVYKLGDVWQDIEVARAPNKGEEGISKSQIEGYTYDPNRKSSGTEPIGSPELPRASVQDSEKIL